MSISYPSTPFERRVFPFIFKSPCRWKPAHLGRCQPYPSGLCTVGVKPTKM